MYCVKCGKELRDGAQFCTGCGAEQRKKAPAGDIPTMTLKDKPVEVFRPEPLKKKGNMPLIAAIVALTLVLTAIVILIFLLPASGGKGGGDDQDELIADSDDQDDSGTDKRDKPTPTEAEPTEEPTPTEEPKPQGIEFTVCVHAANEGRGLPGALVELMYSNQVLKTDASGKADFLLPAAGEYTFRVTADGYTAREDSYMIEEKDRGIVFPIVPVISNEDAYVMVVWKGEQDLDLCIFDTKPQEYVNKAQPEDSKHNFFFADHDAEFGYELAYLRNVRNDEVRTVYVVDTERAQARQPSTMEADGAEIYLYGAGGQWYYSVAKTNQNAPLWSPFYTYLGDAIPQNEAEYISSLGPHKWISFRPEDQYIPH